MLAPLIRCQQCTFAAATDLYYLIQILYRLFESYVHHVAIVNIPTKMAASSVLSVKRC